MKKISIKQVILIISVMLVSQVSLTKSVIEHKQGVLSLESVPQTVITFNIGILDTLDALGVEVAGLPKDYAPQYLDKYKGSQYQDVGSFFEPDIETVVSMAPDLILVGVRSEKAYPTMAKIAPSADLGVWGDDLYSKFKEAQTKIGQIFNKEALVKEKLDKIDTKLEYVKTLAQQSGNVLLVMTNGGKLSTYGPGSRFGWIYDDMEVKAPNIDVKKALHGDPISFEFLLKVNPDHIFVIDRDASIGKSQGAAQALLDNEIVNQTMAAKNGKITYLDGVNWYIVGAGMQYIESMIDEVIIALE